MFSGRWERIDRQSQWTLANVWLKAGTTSTGALACIILTIAPTLIMIRRRRSFLGSIAYVTVAPAAVAVWKWSKIWRYLCYIYKVPFRACLVIVSGFLKLSCCNEANAESFVSCYYGHPVGCSEVFLVQQAKCNEANGECFVSSLGPGWTVRVHVLYLEGKGETASSPCMQGTNQTAAVVVVSTD